MKGYRTLAFNAVMLIIGAVVLFNPGAADELPDAEQVNSLLDQIGGLILIGAPIVNGILRAVTNTPVGKKDV